MRKSFLLFSVLVLTVCVYAQQPFAKYGYKVKVATFSGGRYDEFHDKTRIVEIGSVKFDTKTGKIVGYVDNNGETEDGMKAQTVSRFLSIDPLAEKYYSISPYAYCNNNPLRYIDPDGKDWYSYQDKDGNTVYTYNADIHSQKQLNKVMEGATYHGKTHNDGSTYFSLFGWQFESGSLEAKIMGKMDEAIINYHEPTPAQDPFSSESISYEKSTNFDIGIYASGSSSFKHKTFNVEGGYAVYYPVEKGIENKAKFGGTKDLGKGKVVGMSSWGSANNLPDGIPLRFERQRTKGPRVVHSADLVFTDPAVAKKINNIYDRLFKK